MYIHTTYICTLYGKGHDETKIARPFIIRQFVKRKKVTFKFKQ